MALTIHEESCQKIEMQEFVEVCNSQMDPDDEASVIAMASWLRKLSNNKSILIDHINTNLRDSTWADRLGGYSSQSFVLETMANAFIRVNVWEKSREYDGDTFWEDALYSYGLSHNHNFQLLTAGYWGPGYRTEIHEIDPEGIVGYAGERVCIRFLEHTGLPEGKVMYYRRSRDVHNQIAPEEFSISLNLMPADRLVATTEQFEFDVRNGRIKGIIGNQVEATVSLLTVAKNIGDHRTADLCVRLAAVSPNPRARLAAVDASAALLPSEACGLWQGALKDASELVRLHARAMVETIC